jgi:hypothetical protein
LSSHCAIAIRTHEEKELAHRLGLFFQNDSAFVFYLGNDEGIGSGIVAQVFLRW